MNIGLWTDGKLPNLALMKLSAYHKQEGDNVSWYSPVLHHVYDKIYASKVFTFTKYPFLAEDMIIGGSGHDIYSELPYQIEHIYPDYPLYGIDYAMGFMTRGCIRNCSFCIVPQKEGPIHFNAELSEFCKDEENVMFLDNNFLSFKDHLRVLTDLPRNKRYQFNQGLDIRLIDDNNAELLARLRKWRGQDRRFAFDDIKMESIIREKIRILRKYGIKRSRFYVLIGYNSTYQDDMKRILILKELKQRIFVMPYNKFNSYQRAFARWVNRFKYLKIPFELSEKGNYERITMIMRDKERGVRQN